MRLRRGLSRVRPPEAGSNERSADICGSALVEILVSVSILAIAIIVLASLFPAAMNYQQKAVNVLVSSSEARNTLDQLAAAGWDALLTGTVTSSVSGLPAGNVKTVQIEAYPTSDSKYLRLVTVRISWPGKANTNLLAGEVTYRTLIVKPYKETSGAYADI